MSTNEIRDTFQMIGLTIALLVALGICVAIVFGIPAAAIVWIIETIQS